MNFQRNMEKNSGVSEDFKKAIVEAEDKILMSVPDDKKEEVSKCLAAIRMEMQEYSGPVPPPAFLAEYENVQKGSADRILRMAEKNCDSRIYCEKKTVDGRYKVNLRAQPLALILTILLLVTAVIFMYLGYPGWGGTIAVFVVVCAIGITLSETFQHINKK